MARNELHGIIESIQNQSGASSIWACLRVLSHQGSNREGAAIVASFQKQMDWEYLQETQALAS